MRFAAAIALLTLTLPGFAQYGGPAILSRGEAPSQLNSAQIDFRPYAELAGVYNTGLAGVSVTPQGTLPNVDSPGIRASWGISGTHSWRHARLGLDYRGSLTHYTQAQATTYNYSDEALLLGTSWQFSRHMLLALRESGGMFSQNFVLPGLSQTIPFDPVSSYIPTVDFFNNRTYYGTSQADLTTQLSNRLIVNIGGDYFLDHRQSTALSSARGEAARGDVEYRLSRFTTVGVNYGYTHYAFTTVFGGSNLHTIAGVYSVRLSRTLEFSGYAGVMRVESTFQETAPVDPQIAKLLGSVGVTPAAEIYHHISMQPNMVGRISQRYAKGIAYVSGGHSVTPGNGLFLTSYNTTVQGGYTYTGLRRWSFSANAMYVRSQATGQISGEYATAMALVSATRQLTRATHIVAGVHLRRYDSADFKGYNVNVFEFNLGLGFAPGDLPLRLW